MTLSSYYLFMDSRFERKASGNVANISMNHTQLLLMMALPWLLRVCVWDG
jgi:hypothetical protein